MKFIITDIKDTDVFYEDRDVFIGKTFKGTLDEWGEYTLDGKKDEDYGWSFGHAKALLPFTFEGKPVTEHDEICFAAIKYKKIK